MKLDTASFRNGFTGYGRNELTNKDGCTDFYICRALTLSRSTLIASSKSADQPRPHLVSGLRDSLGTGRLSDSPPVVLASDVIDQPGRLRHSLHRWPFFSILLWSFVTGALLFVFAGLIGCRVYQSLPETTGNDTANIDAIMANIDARGPTEPAGRSDRADDRAAATDDDSRCGVTRACGVS